MLHAQPFGNCAIQVRVGEAQFIREVFSLRVQVRKMVAPAFNLAPRRCDGFRFNACAALHRARRAMRTAGQAVKSAGKSFGCVRAGGNPFFHLRSVDRQIGKHGVAQPAANGLNAAARGCTSQCAWIEVI